MDGGAPASSAEVSFSLKNVGSGAVRVLSVDSGCGCVVPSVEPSLVAGGQPCRVEARGTPLAAGEKTVEITLHTDSKTRPEVVLKLRMVGGRKPPFLLSASANLTYLGAICRDEVRDFSAWVIEAGRATKPPIVRSDLPFLAFEALGVESDRYGAEETVSHHYRWRVTFKESPPVDEFTGAITIQDPWDEKWAERINVHGRPTLPLRIVPSNPSLALDQADPAAGHSSFAILTTVDAEDIQVEAEEADSPLLVVKWTGGQTPRFGTYVVRWKPDRLVVGGTYRLVARSASAKLAHTFQVVVRTEGE